MNSSPLFSGLAAHACVEIAACAQTQAFAPGEALVMQGEPANYFIVLQSGHVKETLRDANGNEALIRFTCKGEAINLQVGNSPLRHTCSARAMTSCTALVWDTCKIEQLLARYPQISINVSHILAEKVQEVEERFLWISVDSVECRLQLLLVRLARQIGEAHRLGTQICLKREELAQMIGTSVFTVSRILSSWSTQGTVIPQKESVILRQPAPSFRAPFLLEPGASDA